VEDPEEEVPEWQKEAVRQTLMSAQHHPEQLRSWNLIKQKYQRP
jgi:hypothetical protein